MKLISKKEPVKPAAPYIWGAKYLVLDSVSKLKDVKAGETVIAISKDIDDGDFTVYTENDYDYIKPEHLQLIDPSTQVEHVPVTVDTAVIGKQYLLIADGHEVPKGETVTLDIVDTDRLLSWPFRVIGSNDDDWVGADDLAELPVEPTSETVYTIELTESELQGIVTAVEQSFEYERVFSARFTDSKVNVSDAASKVYDEILNLLKENKS